MMQGNTLVMSTHLVNLPLSPCSGGLGWVQEAIFLAFPHGPPLRKHLASLCDVQPLPAKVIKRLGTGAAIASL